MKLSKPIIFHDMFLVGIIIKGINGIFEFVGGILLCVVSSEYIIRVVESFFEGELVKDPTDFIANYMIHATHSISFAAAYLIIHGIVKIVLVSSLLAKKIWAYPLAGVVLGVMLMYQMVRIVRTHSITLLLFSLVDIVILLLLHFEYKRVKKKHKGVS